MADIKIYGKLVNSTTSREIADYSQIAGKPIIEQDLSSSFTPAINTYYKHIGESTSTYVKGTIYFYNSSKQFKAIDGARTEIDLRQSTGDSTSAIMSQNAVTTALGGKVDKASGKGLSTNDYTTTEKNKLAKIPEDAQANVIETIEAGSNISITKSGKTVTISATSSGNVGDVTAAGDNTFTGSNIFKNNKVITSNSSGLGFEVQYPSMENKTHYSLNQIDNTDNNGNKHVLVLPHKDGTLALTSDIPIIPTVPTIEANPSLSGNEPELTGITIGSTNYKIPSGGDGGGDLVINSGVMGVGEHTAVGDEKGAFLVTDDNGSNARLEIISAGAYKATLSNEIATTYSTTYYFPSKPESADGYILATTDDFASYIGWNLTEEKNTIKLKKGYLEVKNPASDSINEGIKFTTNGIAPTQTNARATLQLDHTNLKLDFKDSTNSYIFLRCDENTARQPYIDVNTGYENTKIYGGKISCSGDGWGGTYEYTFPKKTGTFAMTNDIIAIAANPGVVSSDTLLTGITVGETTYQIAIKSATLEGTTLKITI